MTHRIDRLLRRAGGDDHGLASQGVRSCQGTGHRRYHCCGVQAPTQFVRGSFVRHPGVADGDPGISEALQVALDERVSKLDGACRAGKHRWPIVQQYRPHQRLVRLACRRFGHQCRRCGHYHQGVCCLDQAVQGTKVLCLQSAVNVTRHDHVPVGKAAERQSGHEDIRLRAEDDPHGGTSALQGAQNLNGSRCRWAAADTEQNGSCLQQPGIFHFRHHCSGVAESEPDRRVGSGGAPPGRWP